MARKVKILPGTQETQVQSLGPKDLLEKGMATHSSIFAWSIPLKSLVDYSPWDRKESDMTEQLILLLSFFLSYFHMLIFHLYIFFCAVSVQIFCLLFSGLVFFLIIEFKIFLYILYAIILSKMCSAKIFLRSEICLFSPLILYYFGLASFTKQIYFNTESCCHLCQ